MPPMPPCRKRWKMCIRDRHKDEVDGIAMALPGFVDANTGYVSNGGALLYNTGTQVGQLVRERCGCRVTLENDGKAAAIAERCV